MAQSIDCNGLIFLLVWSSGGGTLGSALYYLNDFSHVRTYDVASSAQLFEEKLEREWVFHLWAYEKSFRFISRSISFDPNPKFSISEIGPTRIEIEQLPVVAPKSITPRFCPSTYPAVAHPVLLPGQAEIRIFPKFDPDPILVQECSPGLAFTWSTHHFSNLSSALSYFPLRPLHRNCPRVSDHRYNHRPSFTSPSPAHRYGWGDRGIGHH